MARRPRCTHHWMIGVTSSERSHGVCKRCGMARTFSPYNQNKRGFTSGGASSNGTQSAAKRDSSMKRES